MVLRYRPEPQGCLAATKAGAAIPGLDLGEGVLNGVACLAGAAGGTIAAIHLTRQSVGKWADAR